MPMPSNEAIPEDVSGFEKFIANVRGLMFFMWSFFLAIPLFFAMLTIYPAVLMLDKYRRNAQHFLNNFWAKLSTFMFFPITIEGREYLPPPDQPVVYVANHQSFMDIYSLFHLDRQFKFISKASIFAIPIVGWSMYLTGHVALQRMDTRSQLECLKQCRELLDKGASVLFFPEGTRSPDCVMGSFKKGAFSAAVKSKVDIVPITIIGSGRIMPSGKEGQLRPGSVRIVVHPTITTKGRNADEVCDQARNVIASSLPKELVGDVTKQLKGDGGI